MPRVSQILETSLYVEDLVRARAFYERDFGFFTMFDDDRMCAMEVPGEQVLLLFRHGMTDQPAPGPAGLIPPHHGRGALHLAFAIPIGELAAWEDHLSRQDVALESRITWPAVAPASISAILMGIRWRWRRRVCGQTGKAARPVDPAPL